MNKFLEWLKVNKEGAIVGGIVGLIPPILFFSGLAKSGIGLQILKFSSFLHPLFWIIKLSGWRAGSMGMGLLMGFIALVTFPLFFALLGALIDWGWRPKE